MRPSTAVTGTVMGRFVPRQAPRIPYPQSASQGRVSGEEAELIGRPRYAAAFGRLKLRDWSAQPAAAASAAARWPDWMAPSIVAYQLVAVSTPAQWTRPNGRRMAGPKPKPV